jgi:replicative DNA helicase
LAEVIVAKHRNGPTGDVKLAFFPQHMRFENKALGSTEQINLDR